MNVAHLLHEQALAHPERRAIVDRTRRRPYALTFAELDRAARQSAGACAAAGLRPGARVLVLHSMSAPLYVALAGMLGAGLVPVVCEPGTVASLPFVPDALFGSDAALAYALTVPSLRRIPLRIGTRRLLGGPASAAVERAAGDPALLTATSGSTGAPKVVVRSHGHLRAQLDAIRTGIGIEPVEVTTMPIVLLANLACGVTSVIPGVDLRRPGAADPERLADDIAATAATGIVASPAMLERLARSETRGRLQTLRRIVAGGAPVMPPLPAALRRAAPQARLVTVYGSTEAEPIAVLRADDLQAADFAAMRNGAGLLAGGIVAGTSVRIVDGEIVVAGAHVVTDGGDWHRTGDLGYFDEVGRLWLTGRAAAATRDARGSLEPFQVECALSFDERIARTALAAVDARRIVVVEPRRNARITTAEVRATIGWASIDDVRIVPHIPVDRRHNAKVDYPALRALLTESR